MTEDFLREAAQKWPERRALSDLDRSWTYAELDEWVSGLAHRIGEEDAPAEADALALVVPPTPEGIATLFAASRAHTTVAPLNPALTESECTVALRALTGSRPGGCPKNWSVPL